LSDKKAAVLHSYWLIKNSGGAAHLLADKIGIAAL
jgi:hypothetical protein